MAAAVADATWIGSAVGAANAAVARSTTTVAAAAADEVSAAIAALFGAHGQQYQAISAQAAAFHARFVRALTAAADSYGEAEAANGASMVASAQALPQDLLGAVNAHSVALTGRPLIGNGANGAPGTGQNGAPGGWLLGNGGAGGSGA
ncbi:PE family protein, partial [Mycobacterium shinjukuense]